MIFGYLLKICVADTDEQAEVLRSSQYLAFANLRMGRPGKLPHPVADVAQQIPAPVLAQVKHALSVSATGTPEMVRDQLAGLLARHQPDELMVTGMIHDHSARVRSFTLAGEVLSELRA